MLWTMGALLLIAWALGLVAGVTLSGFIHVLLLVAVIAVAFELIAGRKSTKEKHTMVGDYQDFPNDVG